MMLPTCENFKRSLRGDLLGRCLQGWDEDDMKKGPGMTRPAETVLPYRTIFPAVQFVLAGIIGKPATYCQVPIVRFAFGIICHL